MAKTTTIAQVSYTDFFPEEEPQKPVSYTDFFPEEAEPTAPPAPELPALPKRPVQPTPRPEPLTEARYRAMAELVPKRRDPSVREPMESERRELYALADLASERLGEDEIARRVRRQTVDEEIGKFATRSARAQQAVQQGRLPTRRAERAESDFRLFSDTLAREAGVAGRPRPSLLETAKRGYVGAAKVLARSAVGIPEVVTGTIPRALAAPARAIGRPLGRGFLKAIPGILGEGDIGRPEEAAGLTAALREMVEAPDIQQVAEGLGQSAARATQFAALAPIEIPAMLAEHATTLLVKGARRLGIDNIPLPKEVEETPVWQSGLGLALGVALGVLGRARGAFLQKAAKTADPAAKQALLDTAKRLQQGSAALFAGPAVVGAATDGADVIRQGGDYATAIAAVVKRLAEGAISYAGFRLGGWGATKLRQATARVRSDTEAELRRAGKVTKAAEVKVERELPVRIAGEKARRRMLRGRAVAEPPPVAPKPLVALRSEVQVRSELRRAQEAGPRGRTQARELQAELNIIKLAKRPEAKIPPPVAPKPEAPVPEAPVAPAPPAVPKPPPKPALAVPRAIPQPAQKLYAEIARIRKQVGTGKPTLEQGARLRKLGAELTKKPDITPEDLAAAREAGGIRLEAQLRRALAAKKAAVSAEVTRPLEPPTAKPALRRPPTAELGEMIGRGAVGPLRKPTRAEALIARQLGRPIGREELRPRPVVPTAPAVPPEAPPEPPPKVRHAASPVDVKEAVGEVVVRAGKRFKAERGEVPRGPRPIRYHLGPRGNLPAEAHVNRLFGRESKTYKRVYKDVFEAEGAKLETMGRVEAGIEAFTKRHKVRAEQITAADKVLAKNPGKFFARPILARATLAKLKGVQTGELLDMLAAFGPGGNSKQTAQFFKSKGIVWRHNEATMKPIKFTSPEMSAMFRALPDNYRRVIEGIRTDVRGRGPGAQKANLAHTGKKIELMPDYYMTRRVHEPELGVWTGGARPAFDKMPIFQPLIGGKQPFVAGDIFDSYYNYRQQVATMTHMAGPISRAWQIMNTRDVKRAMRGAEKRQPDVSESINRALQAVSGMGGRKLASWEKSIAGVTQRAQQAALLGKLHTMGIQTTSIIQAMTEAGSVTESLNILKGLRRIAVPNKAFEQDFLRRNAWARRRWNRNVSRIISGFGSETSPARRALGFKAPLGQRAMGGTLGRMDRRTVMGVAQGIHDTYSKTLKGEALWKKINPIIRERVERTQPPMSAMHVPDVILIARHRPAIRPAVAFRTFTSKLGGLVVDAADTLWRTPNPGVKDYGKFAGTLLGVLANVGAVHGIRRGLKRAVGGPALPPEQHLRSLGRGVFGTWLGTGDAISAIVDRTIEGRGYFWKARESIVKTMGTDALRAWDEMMKSLKRGQYKHATERERKQAAIRGAESLLRLIGSLTGAPTHAPLQIVKPHLPKPKRPGLQRKPVLRRRTRRR